MIDAYEVGIQLLLQDDVTAGLAVISRELAEVDRAIAATSASLAGLVHKVEGTTNAVALGKVVQPVMQQLQSNASPTAPEMVSAPNDGADTVPVARVIDKTVRPDAVSDTPVAPVTSPSSPPSEVQGGPKPSEPLPSSAAPANASEILAEAAPSQVTYTGATEQASARPSAHLEKTAPTAREISAGPVGSHGWDTAPPHPGETGSSVSEKREAAWQGRQVAITASVSRARIAGVPAKSTETLRADVMSGAQESRSAATAPWSGVDQVGLKREPTRTVERAAAPASQTQGRSEGGGGTVMLDGRLVGQWLSDHMASEASRPPGGTSFFDSRQTPAWNISGAL